MKYYDGKKIKEYIRTHSDGLCAVEIGMGEDWSWTAEEVWRGGKFRKNLNRRFIKVRGISGSYWATPTLYAIFDDGRTEMIPVYWEDNNQASAEDIQRMKQFARATAFDGSLEQEG
jgi:hypothetical protein